MSRPVGGSTGWPGRFWRQRSDVLIAHDHPTAETARRDLRVRGSIQVLHHPAYADVYPAGRPRRVVRRALDIPDDTFTLLCFGHVRAYKDVRLILVALAGLPDEALAVIIAGLPVDQVASAAVRLAAASDRRIVTRLEFVPDDRVAELHAAADAALVTRSDGGTSGALVLALSLGVPVVAAEPYRDQVGDAGWMFRPGDAVSLREAIQAAAADPALAVRRRAARARARAWTWEAVGAHTARLFERGGGSS